ncbi:hypothetical protein AC578_6410 [Pseudocercospora eumusae]|uniref:Uncharacterized protein n=1 Tax=Pseudocercospora eumusae TaxID=321146 RepID=A0A139H6T5_9PEZI|nr:hypothetical protein AC578_6410 [Pseudocercospora eumusae]
MGFDCYDCFELYLGAVVHNHEGDGGYENRCDVGMTHPRTTLHRYSSRLRPKTTSNDRTFKFRESNTTYTSTSLTKTYSFIPQSIHHPKMSSHLKTLKSHYPWLQSPIITLAPMRHYSGPKAALSVTSAGGLGFMNPQTTKEALFKDLGEARDLVKTKYSRILKTESELPSVASLPIGLGFLLWAVKLSDAIESVAQYRPAAVWLYGGHGGQKELDEWSEKLREASPGVKIWVMIGTLQEARELVVSPNPPDVIVVQGFEAGGHGRATDGSSWTTLLPEVSEVVQGKIPLFVAGGIVDGRGVAAALAMGAAGVVMGTRFLASEEIRISRGYQEHVLNVEDGAKSTTKTLLWNHLNGVYGWPKWLMPRGIINRSFTDQQAGVSFEELQRLHDEAKAKGDAAWGVEGRTATYAGMGVGLIKEVKQAAAIVEEVRAEALAIIRGLAEMNSKL